MAISHPDFTRLFGNPIQISNPRMNGKQASAIIYDDVQTLYKGPKMHKESVFRTLWSVRTLSILVSNNYYTPTPEDILCYEMHSRHLTKCAREYIFANIEAFHNIYEERSSKYNEPALSITNAYKSLLEVNMYRHANKEGYVLPDTLTSNQKLLLSYYQSVNDLNDEIPF